MSLDFLSPDRASAELGFEPELRSPMARAQRDAGARFEQRDGWLVPASFPGEEDRLQTVGVADLSHLGKIEARGLASRPSAREIVEWFQIRSDLGLAICEYRDCFVLRSSLARRAALVLDQTGAMAILALVGPRATDVLQRLTHLHEFPSVGSLAHIAAHVLARPDGYWIVFAQEYGHYLWEVVIDAAEPFGGGPVGADAVQGGRA